MARPKIHDQAAAERLLSVAAGRLKAAGPDALSVRTVAEAAETSHRAVYALFGSKQGMIDALAAHGYLALAAGVSALAAGDDPAADLVRAGVEGFRPFAIGNPALFRLTFEQISADALKQPRVVEAAIESYEALAAWMTRVQDAGKIHPDRNIGDCIFAFHAACQGLASCELAALPPPGGPGFWGSRSASDLDEVWADTLRSVVAGFEREP